MAKQIEPYEEDDFLLEEQNSNEEQIIEEEEFEDESSLKLRPRPPRASLTHNAIKSEILKMKKQDSGEDNEEFLSRSARKRKKRREKVLEERRASGGRGENFEDDLAHFKSIPISRRRSSVLPQTISLPNHNNGDGFCSTLKCCLWVLMVIGALIGLLYVWPTVADLEVTDQSNTFSSEQSELQPEQLVNNEVDEGETIINNINKLNEELDGVDNQEENQDENQDENQEESIGTFDYFSSFFGSENTANEPEEQQDNVQSDEQKTETQNNHENINLNEEINEPIIIESTIPDNDQVETEFEELKNNEQSPIEQWDFEDTLLNNVPERYKSAVHQDEADNLEGEENNACKIGDQFYDGLDDAQCNLLQERQRQLEEQLRQQEQSNRQEQSNNNEEQEQFYFF